MSEVRSIRDHARATVELFTQGIVETPENPCEPGTEQHKEWTAAYYQHGTTIGLGALAA